MIVLCAHDELVKIDNLKEHPESKNYLACACGAIYSKYKNGFIKQQTRKDGYLQFIFHGKNKLSHRFVSECFKGLNKKEINHINGNKQDNSIKNIEFVTRSENIKHSMVVLNNKHNFIGEKNSNCKIKDRDLPHIKKLLLGGHKKKDIAIIYGVNKATILAKQKIIKFTKKEKEILKIALKENVEQGRQKRWK